MTNRFSGLLLIVIAAVVGYALITLPPSIIQQHKSIAESSSFLAVVYLIAVGIGLTLLGSALSIFAYRLWKNTKDKAEQRRRDDLKPSQLSRSEIKEEIDRKVSEAAQYAEDSEGNERELLEQSTKQVQEKLDQQTLEIIAFGTISSGKSSLMNALVGKEIFQTDARGGTTVNRSEVPWPGADRVILVDTPGLGEIQGEIREALARTAARDADVILFVVDGPMKDFEHDVLQQLLELEKKILLCLNKQDWYTDEDREQLRQQIQEQVQKWIPPNDVLSVRSKEASRTRVRVTAGGEEIEETVHLEPDITSLANRMLQVVEKDGRDLLLANLLLRSRGLVADARERVRASLDKRALEIVERFTWQAGGAAAISPLPILDVAAGMTISSKMVFELARVYRQNVDLEVARRLVGELGKNLIAIVGATAITPAVSTMVASFLKTIPGIGTLAGGVLQGITQSLVTRWMGRVFMAYFRNEMQEPEGGLAALAREKWREVTKASELANLAQKGWKTFGKREKRN